jgi:hypothetical protein
MSKPYSPEDIEYIKGFEAGCDYICNEIERAMRETPGSETVLAPLLRHLKSTPGNTPIKKLVKTLDKV